MPTRAEQRAGTPSPPFVIRPALVRDADSLARLYQRYRLEARRPSDDDAPPDAADCRRHIRQVMRRTNGEILLAVDGHCLLGFCIVRTVTVARAGLVPERLDRRVAARIRDGVRRWLGRRPAAAPPGRRIAFMDDLYVATEARTRGVALPLMRRAFQWGRAQGVSTMEGATSADNAAMLRLARHFDMQVTRVLLRMRLS